MKIKHKEQSAMKLFRLRGVLLLAVFVAALALSAVAAADETPLNLPFTAGEKFSGKSEGEPEFVSSNGTVICKEAKAVEAESAYESNLPPLGKFKIDFTGCTDKTVKEPCTGLGEASGTILVGGTFHLVWDEEGATFELTVGTLFLVNTVHFICGIAVLFTVEGEQLCLDLKPTESSKTHSFHCVANGLKQKDSWCKKDVAGCKELVVPVLKTSINEAVPGESAELALGNVTQAASIAAMAL
jgi:hypothetical protein